MTDFFEDAKKRQMSKQLICKSCGEDFIKLEDGLCKSCKYGEKPQESQIQGPPVRYEDQRQDENRRIERRKHWMD